MNRTHVIQPWPTKSLGIIFSNPQLTGTLLLVLLVIANVEAAYVSNMLDRSIWETSSADLLNWTIGARGQGLVILPFIACVLLSMSTVREDSSCYIVAHGSPRRYVASRVIDAIAIALFVSAICFATWYAVVAAIEKNLINWSSNTSLFFGITSSLSSINAATLYVQFFFCIFACSLYASLGFVAVELLTGTTILATGCVMSVALIGFVAPQVNEFLALLPDVYALTAGTCPLSWVTPLLLCMCLIAVALLRYGRKDFLNVK